jgi:hypothetical protein
MLLVEAGVQRWMVQDAVGPVEGKLQEEEAGRQLESWQARAAQQQR